MLREIKLLGILGEKFGETMTGDVNSIRDVFRLIDCQRKGFRAFILEAVDKGLDASILIGDHSLETEEVLLENIQGDTIYVTLVPAGSGNNGFKKILTAIAIIAFALYPPAGILGKAAEGLTFAQQVVLSIGIQIGLQGVAELLTKVPKSEKAEAENQLFSSAENTAKQGVPVPILYGKLLVPGTAISVDFKGGELLPTLPAVPDVTDLIGISNTNLNGASISQWASGNRFEI